MCIKSRSSNYKKSKYWLPTTPHPGQLGLTSAGGVLCNEKGKVLFAFFNHVGVIYSNELKMLVILEASRIYSYNFLDSFVECE